MFIFNKHSIQSHPFLLGVMLGGAVLISTVISVLFASPSFAIMTTDTKPSDRATSYSYLKAMKKCVESHMRSNIRTTVVSNGATSPSHGQSNSFWFDDLDASVTVYPDGKLNCASVTTKALALWGWTDTKQFLQDIGYTYNDQVPEWQRSNDARDRANDFVTAVTRKVGNVDALLNGAAKYALYLGIFANDKEFLSSCSARQLGVLSSLDSTQQNAARNNEVRDGRNYTVIKLYDATTKTMVDYGYSFLKQGEGGGTTTYASVWNYRGSNYTGGTDGNGERYSCEQLPGLINANAPFFSRWVADNPEGDIIPGVSGPITGDGCTTNDAECETDESSCTIDGVGWILCPVLYFGAQLADSSYGFLADNFLYINPGLLNTDPNATVPGTTTEVGNGTFLAWGVIRNIANVVFVIVFLIVIFSQLTGIGVSNYGVKKLLPRLIVGAILVNISFYICQIAVDLSNIIGFGLKELLSGVAEQVRDAGGGPAVVTEGDQGNLLGIVTLVIAGGALIYFNLAAVLLAVLGGIIVLLVIFLILTARQALVVLFIVIAPLAFIAYLLPNTEPFFQKWRKIFTALLMLFPIIGLVYGAGLIASSILLQVAEGNTGSTDNTVMKVAAYLALVLPLIIVIPLLRAALSAIPAIGNAIERMGNKSNGYAQSGAKRAVNGYKNSGFGKFRAGKASERRARIAAGTYVGVGGKLNPRNLFSKGNATLNTSGKFNTVTGGFGAYRDLSAQAQNRSDQKEALDMFSGDDILVKAWAATGGNKSTKIYENLDTPQKRQFDKMVEAGHDRRASSFLASAQYLSESGKGNFAEVTEALERAKQVGANETIISGAEQSAIASYRNSGRGDMVSQLQTAINMRSTDATKRIPFTEAQAWAQVSADKVHREALDFKKNPAGRAGYEAYLQSNPEHARQALAGYDHMEQRAKDSAESAIVYAAKVHQYNATGTAPTVKTIQDAKKYFDVK